MPSLSRRLAQFAAGLRYEDLPSAVVDRAKGVTLQALTSVLIGSQTNAGKQAVRLIAEEEAGVKKGATILTDGTLVTKGGAAFANSELALAGGKYDTFRMLTHARSLSSDLRPVALVPKWRRRFPSSLARSEVSRREVTTMKTTGRRSARAGMGAMSFWRGILRSTGPWTRAMGLT
jgi:hypothetical protein